MKTCEEMVGTLLLRRADYEAKRKARRQTVLRISTVACSLALVLLVGAGVNQGWWVTVEPELPTVTSTQTVTDPTHPDHNVVPPTAPTYLPVTEPLAKNHIAINEIDSFSSARMYIALMVDDFVPMTEGELNAYYGISIFPEVPDDLGEEWSASEGIPFGIYRRDGGTGEVYHDQQVLNWSTEDFSRWINIELRKGGMPFQCFRVATTEFENSVISGEEVFIGRRDDGMYLVEFMYRDVGFRLIAEGLTQEELVAVIASLIS